MLKDINAFGGVPDGGLPRRERRGIRFCNRNALTGFYSQQLEKMHRLVRENDTHTDLI